MGRSTAAGHGSTSWLVALLAVAVGGCDSSTPLLSTVVDSEGAGGARMGTGGGTGGSGSGVIGGGGGTPGLGDFTPAAAQALCGQPLGQRLAIASIATMQQTLHRGWVLCSPVGLFRRPQAGITIGADDRWAYLTWSGDQLVALHGLDNEGSVEYIDTSGVNGRPTIQVNFVSDLAVTIIAAPAIIGDVPRTLLINNEGVETYTYAAVP